MAFAGQVNAPTYIHASIWDLKPIDEELISYGEFIQTTQNPETPERVEVKVVPKVRKGVGNGQCVAYAKYLTKAPYSGDAWLWGAYINSQEASVGAIVVFSGGIGHLAVVLEVREMTILITEQNYKGLYIISQREILKTNNLIRGYIVL